MFILYPTLQGHFSPYPTRSFRTLPYKDVLYHTQQGYFITYHTWSCLTLPYKVVSYYTLQGHFEPYSTRSFHWPFLKYLLVPILQKINNSAAGIKTPLTLNLDTCCTIIDFCRLGTSILFKNGQYPTLKIIYYTLRYHVILFPTIQGCFVPWGTRSFCALTYNVTSYPTLQGPFVPNHTRSFHTLPKKVISYSTLQSHFLTFPSW